MELPIQESSPASEMMASLGWRTNSSTGMVVPVMRFCGVPELAGGTGLATTGALLPEPAAAPLDA